MMGKAKQVFRRDRISNLSDDVVREILSYMLTDAAVRTSVLSKRWRYLYASLPVIGLDDYSRRRSKPEAHVNVMDQVLVLHKLKQVRKFHIHLHRNCFSFSDVERWFYTALVSPSVEEIRFSAIFVDLGYIPFDSPKLVVLNVDCRSIRDFPDPVNLPSLRTLHLKFHTLPSVDWFQKLLSGSPILEELSVFGYSVSYRSEGLRFVSSSLKRLTLALLWDCFLQPRNRCDGIEISAPKLEILRVTNCFAVRFCMDLCSLVKADVTIHGCLGSTVQFLRQISNVKFLCLYQNAILALLGRRRLELPLFPNLTRLEVKSNTRGLRVLTELLDHTPKLEVLILDMQKAQYLWYLKSIDAKNDEKLKHKLSNWMPECMTSIAEIHYKGFGSEWLEIKLMVCFLKNATSLEKLTISTRNVAADEKSAVVDKLRVTYGSSACQVVFSQ